MTSFLIAYSVVVTVVAVVLGVRSYPQKSSLEYAFEKAILKQRRRVCESLENVESLPDVTRELDKLDSYEFLREELEGDVSFDALKSLLLVEFPH